jgi:hypothetical protein
LLRSKSDSDDMCAVKIMSSEINNHPFYTAPKFNGEFGVQGKLCRRCSIDD